MLAHSEENMSSVCFLKVKRDIISPLNIAKENVFGADKVLPVSTISTGNITYLVSVCSLINLLVEP